jgi:aryl-alcohol dehydrogenase-like predicted oxidoreductase
MKQRSIGNTGIKVTALGIGCNNFGLRIDAEASRAVIHKALDLGITFWDTADVYGKRGGSETCLGRNLGPRRKDIFLATKFGGAMDEAGTLRGASRQYIMRAVEASLKRLQTDWIDLYQLHHFDAKTPLDETMRALDDLVKQGKVRYLGFSTLVGWPFVDMQWTARQLGTTPLTCCESEYSLLKRGAERDLIPAMLKHGAQLLPYYPLAGGFLTGKYKRGAALPEGGRITKGARYQGMFINDTNWDILEKLEAFSAARGHTLLELAFAWLLAQPVIATVIAGATRPEQLETNARAVDWELTPAEVAEVNEISKKDA